MKPRLNYDTFIAIMELETNRGIDQCQPILYSNAMTATVLEKYDTATMVAQKVQHTHVNVVKGQGVKWFSDYYPTMGRSIVRCTQCNDVEAMPQCIRN